LEIKEKLTAQSKKGHEVEREVEDRVVNTLFQKELQAALRRKAEANGEKFDAEKNAEADDDSASSYYDTESDGDDGDKEKQDDKQKDKKKTDEEEKAAEDQENDKNIENYLDKKTTGKSQPVDDIEDADMVKKMRREWEQMQGDPSKMDEKLKA